MRAARQVERRESTSLISRESAHRLIRAWVYTEVADSYAECGYPASAAVVGEYVPHRDDEREEVQAREAAAGEATVRPWNNDNRRRNAEPSDGICKCIPTVRTKPPGMP